MCFLMMAVVTRQTPTVTGLVICVGNQFVSLGFVLINLIQTEAIFVALEV